MANVEIEATPREARYALRGETEVTIERRHDRSPRFTRGLLLDLTISGAKLATKSPLPIEESVTLFFRFGELDLNFMAETQIRWTRPFKEPLWWMGCVFSPKIPEKHLASLAGEGILDRRREPRRDLGLPALARWELVAQEVAVQIVDFSSGGLCLRSPQSAQPGQRVLIQAVGSNGRRLLIPTRCQWQVESRPSYLLGCSFVEATGCVRLHEAARAAAVAAIEVARPRRSWLWPWVAGDKGQEVKG